MYLVEDESQQSTFANKPAQPLQQLVILVHGCIVRHHNHAGIGTVCSESAWTASWGIEVAYGHVGLRSERLLLERPVRHKHHGH